MKTIVTGAAGFIGSHVVASLIKSGHDVLAIDDLSGGTMENVCEGATFIKTSINDSLEEMFANYKPDFVYHLAAYAAEGLSHHIPLFNYQNNVLGTVNVLNATYLSGASHFIFTSSIAAYGHPQGTQSFDETSNCMPCDPYGSAKLACEFHIKAFVEYYGNLKYTIFRPHNVFGPNQNISDPYRNVVGIFMAKALQKAPMPIFGDGGQTRSFSYVDVVSESIANAPFIQLAENEIFNIGGDASLSVKELAEKISLIFDVPLNIEWLPVRKEVTHAHCTHNKAKSVFKSAYDRSVSIDEGLKLMAADIIRKPVPKVTECPSPIEIFDLLPPSWANRLLKK